MRLLTFLCQRAQAAILHSAPGWGRDLLYQAGWLLLQSEPVQRVDYLFLGKSASGKKLVLLVELKGGGFGKALDQIESTLQFLCKQSAGNVIHNSQHRDALAHDAPQDDGVRAYVILSHGRKVGLRLRRAEAIRKRFGVRVYAREMVSVTGLDALSESPSLQEHVHKK